MSSPSSPNLVNHYCLVIQSAVSNLLDATLNPLKTCLFHLSLRIQPEGAYMATINSIMSSICQPGPIGPYNVDLRFDIIVEGDVSVKSYRAGSSEPMFQDTAMQTELRLWSGPASDHKGIFKPDTMCVLKVTVLETGVQSQLLSLVGEGKVDLFSGGVPVGSSASESRDNASALTANDRTREGKKWRIGTAKVMVYLLSAHQAFGTYLGITIVGPKFARLLHLGDDLIALECEDTFFNNMSVSDHSQLASAFLSNLDNLDHLPHILSSSSNNRDVSLNNAALDTMLETYRAAASIFLNLPATQHLSRIPPHDPTAPLTSAIIYRAIQHNISDDRERFHLVEHCRRGVIWKSPPQPLSRTRRRENDREDDGGPGQGGTRGFESSKRTSARLEERRQGERAKESGRSTRAGQVDGRTRSDMAKENGLSSRRRVQDGGLSTMDGDKFDQSHRAKCRLAGITNLIPYTFPSTNTITDMPCTKSPLLLPTPVRVAPITRTTSSQYPEGASEKVLEWITRAHRSAVPVSTAIYTANTASLPNLDRDLRDRVAEHGPLADAPLSDGLQSPAEECLDMAESDVLDSISNVPSLTSKSSVTPTVRVMSDVVLKALMEAGVRLVMVSKTEMDGLVRERAGSWSNGAIAEV